MASKTSIEWATDTWGPIIGCDRVSDGCDGCYAIPTSRIRESNPHPAIAAAFAGTTKRTDNGIDWSGQVNLLEDRLTQPLGWKKPRKVFVNSLSDLFHKNVPTEFIARILAIMALTPQHTYQVLTKRHARMRSVMTDRCDCGNGHVPGIHLRSAMAWAVSKANPDRIPGMPDDAEQRVWNTAWPLPNLWLGVSVENQHWANLRVPALVNTPAAVRFLSCEPLLGPVDLTQWMPEGHATWRCQGRGCGRFYSGPSMDRCPDCGAYGLWTGSHPGNGRPSEQPISWVIAGGESGRKARPAALAWYRDLRDQCASAQVPYFFKQHGEYRGFLTEDDPSRDPDLYVNVATGQALPEAQVPETGSWSGVWRLGKKAAGRVLDGRTHDDFPETLKEASAA